MMQHMGGGESMTDRNDHPSPAEIEEAVGRIKDSKQRTTVEIQMGKHWRAVRVTQLRSLPNKIKPELTILFFKPTLLVSTPGMTTLDAWVALTLEGASNNRCTLISDVNMDNPREALHRGRDVGFRYPNPKAKSYMQQQFARAMGMRYRNKKLVKPDEYEYTRKP